MKGKVIIVSVSRLDSSVNYFNMSVPCSSPEFSLLYI
jgi:hypothetical protein